MDKKFVLQMIALAERGLGDLAKGPGADASAAYSAWIEWVVNAACLLFAESRGILAPPCPQTLRGAAERGLDVRAAFEAIAARLDHKGILAYPEGLSDGVARDLIAHLLHLWEGAEGPDLAILGYIYEPFLDYTPAWQGGAWRLESGKDRRSSGSHYTPSSFCVPIVQKTLAPQWEKRGANPTVGAILDVKVCDPAMGGGVFLMEALRQIADKLQGAGVEAGKARRMAAESCIYGVDKNPMATFVARRALWLCVGDATAPWDFMDQKLKTGDALVGLSVNQIREFDWKAPAQWGSPFDLSEVEALKARGDALVAAFFGGRNKKEREALRLKYRDGGLHG